MTIAIIVGFFLFNSSHFSFCKRWKYKLWFHGCNITFHCWLWTFKPYVSLSRYMHYNKRCPYTSSDFIEFWMNSLVIVATLPLGLWPRQGFVRGWAKRETRECGKVWEWTLTLLSELPCWELESRWTPKSSKSDYKGQNPFPWIFFCIIGNTLKRRCPKWARMTHLDVCNTSYDQKKGQESNWEFDSQPRKVKNQPNSLTCRWHATHHWKALDKGYNFSLDLIPIRGLHKLWTRKVTRVTTLVITGTKCHSDAIPMRRCKVYYMGEGGGFPRVWVVVSLVNPRLLVVHLSTKGVPTMH
jgi:hypothetical protein